MTVIVHCTSVHVWNDTRIFLKMAASLASAGYVVHLVAIDRSASEDRRFVDRGVNVHLLRGADIADRRQRMLKGATRVLDRAASLSPDLVHFHDPEMIPFALLRARRLTVVYDAHENVPQLVYSREWLPAPLRHITSFALHWLERLGCAAFAGVIGATPTIANRFPKAKRATIQNLPIAGELTMDSDNAPWEDRPQQGIYVGGISEARGILPLVEAIGKSRSIEHFDLVGTFENDGLLQAAKAIAGWDKVTYHGQLGREQLRPLLARARFGAVTFLPHPNHVDAQPNKLFEYLSVGLPVLASDFPLWRDILGDELAAYVDPADGTSVAAGIDLLLSADPAVQRSRSKMGRELIETELNWDREFQRLREFYSQILGRGPRST